MNTTCETVYEVVKADRYWKVLKNGQDTKREGTSYARSFKLKREAEAFCIQDAESDRINALHAEQDRTGLYIWSDPDNQQIDEYAIALRENKLRWTMTGQFQLQDIGRREQEKDAAVLTGPRERWLNPDRLFAEKRRIMAARCEAFKRAGLTL